MDFIILALFLVGIYLVYRTDAPAEERRDNGGRWR